ncbi:MAG TPA: GSU2403 family nucleotidyltransferase fold protein [Labilithrix sp.]|nr:GSU2403 family nucleotidyltransferase fold protein [Labilithrix sp.]
MPPAPATLFTRHPLVLQTSYSEIKRQAAEQPLVLVGTPGSVSVREVNGSRFYYRQFYDPQGKKRADYVGPVADAATEERVTALRERIELTNALVKDARLLAQRGYMRVDPRTNAILASLANHGLFRGGALLVGSHAYGALLNELGVRAAAFSTEDVDVARGEPLDLATPSGEVADFARMLADSTIPLQPVPQLKRDAPSTSYKPPGADRLRVDLLAPARGREVTTRAVPELKAHATALPHLAYVLASPIDAAILGRESVISVRVPRPEALAWHKMLVSQLRGATNEKRSKDLEQASVLFAVLAEDAPDALEEALAAVPRAARTQTLAGAGHVLRRLEATPHARAIELMKGLL